MNSLNIRLFINNSTSLKKTKIILLICFCSSSKGSSKQSDFKKALKKEEKLGKDKI